MKPYLKDQVTIHLKPVEQFESLRVCIDGDHDLSFTDPEESSDFLRTFFNYSDDDIKEYWKVKE